MERRKILVVLEQLDPRDFITEVRGSRDKPQAYNHIPGRGLIETDPFEHYTNMDTVVTSWLALKNEHPGYLEYKIVWNKNYEQFILYGVTVESDAEYETSVRRSEAAKKAAISRREKKEAEKAKKVSIEKLNSKQRKNLERYRELHEIYKSYI